MTVEIDWLQRLINLENDKSLKDFYLFFTNKNPIGEKKYILIKNSTYTDAKKYTLGRFHTNFESLYLKEEVDLSKKELYETVVINRKRDYLIYLM